MVKKTDFNTKVTEIVDKIPSINGLATNSELIAVENKIRVVSSLVKRTDYATEITSIKNDYVTNAASALIIQVILENVFRVSCLGI